jgi:exodeoxyribonuclease VII small subunit
MPSKEKSYRELQDELATILERVEHASYEELDELLKDYDQGMKLVASLEKKLATAKNSIKKAPK